MDRPSEVFGMLRYIERNMCYQCCYEDVGFVVKSTMRWLDNVVSMSFFHCLWLVAYYCLFLCSSKRGREKELEYFFVYLFNAFILIFQDNILSCIWCWNVQWRLRLNIFKWGSFFIYFGCYCVFYLSFLQSEMNIYSILNLSTFLLLITKTIFDLSLLL